MYSKDVSDLDPIQFRALDEGLGIHPSAFKISRPIQKNRQKNNTSQILKEPTSPSLNTGSYTFLAFLCDELFILFFFGLLCGLASWQLGIRDFQTWVQFIQKGFVLFFHFLLFMMISLFYFLFFNQFKTPSLGDLFTRRVNHHS